MDQEALQEALKAAIRAFEQWKAADPETAEQREERLNRPQGILVPCKAIADLRRDYPPSEEQQKEWDRRLARIRQRSAELEAQLDQLERRMAELPRPRFPWS